MKKVYEPHVQEAFARFMVQVGKQRDPVMMLLRAHLYSEAVMEDLIRLGLPQGEVVNKRANLEYHQKVLLVEALDILEARLIAALKALNKVRNGFAHKIEKQLTFGDVLQIGASFERKLQNFREKADSDTVKTLKLLLSFVCGRLDAALHDLKNSSTSPTTAKETSR